MEWQRGEGRAELVAQLFSKCCCKFANCHFVAKNKQDKATPEAAARQHFLHLDTKQTQSGCLHCAQLGRLLLWQVQVELLPIAYLSPQFPVCLPFCFFFILFIMFSLCLSCHHSIIPSVNILLLLIPLTFCSTVSFWHSFTIYVPIYIFYECLSFSLSISLPLSKRRDSLFIIHSYLLENHFSIQLNR